MELRVWSGGGVGGVYVAEWGCLGCGVKGVEWGCTVGVEWGGVGLWSGGV